MEPFSANAWQYDAHNPSRVLSQLPAELLQNTTIKSLALMLHDHGGKALGLRICERLIEGSAHLRVPHWTALTASSLFGAMPVRGQWVNTGTGQIKIRSSARLEDWLSGKAGEQQSRTVENRDRVLLHAREVSGRQHAVVLQKFVEGIGLVADIAHSQILGRTIIRVSTGREQRFTNGARLFTSATNDHEGRHEVIDPVAGTFLTKRVTGTLFERSCLRLDLIALAKELWTRVLALGITFGVQLELIIHPDFPDVWWLVQIRPSPDQVRDKNLTFTPLPGALVTTPAISGSFAATQMAELTTDQSYRWLFHACCEGIDETIRQLGEYRTPGILIWHRDPDMDFGILMLESAFNAGAVVQVTRRVTTVSTTHGVISSHLMAVQDAHLPHGGLIAIPDDIHTTLVQQLNAGPQRMSTISDGLVGQIAFL